MSRPRGTNKHRRIKVQSVLVCKAAEFVNELDVKHDLVDVVFDYARQRIEIFNRNGLYLSSRKFTE